MVKLNLFWKEYKSKVKNLELSVLEKYLTEKGPTFKTEDQLVGTIAGSMRSSDLYYLMEEGIIGHYEDLYIEIENMCELVEHFSYLIVPEEEKSYSSCPSCKKELYFSDEEVFNYCHFCGCQL